jgi:hypothetical protein
MHNSLKPFILRLALAAGVAASAASVHAQSASATISGVQNGANYDYTIIFKNTGSDNLNSFWYAWTTSGNNLPSNPSSAANTVGWNNGLDGNSIQWVNEGSGTALTPGQSATFTFVDSSTPTAITAGSSGESVAYVGGIDFSQGVSGDSTGVFSPVLVVPEPSSIALLAVGAGLMAFSVRRMTTVRQS